MSLRAAHHGYAYQDLVTGLSLVDLVLGVTTSVTVDVKGFPHDLFDDLTITSHTGARVRIQVKHTTADRLLTESSFSDQNRSLRLDRIFDSVLVDLASAPETLFRIVLRDGEPDNELSQVLCAVTPDNDPGDPLTGLPTKRFRFDPDALLSHEPWSTLVARIAVDDLRLACKQLVVDTSAPSCSLSFAEPGGVERALLRRATEDLGAGRAPNTRLSPEFVARALAQAATAARSLTGDVSRESLLPELGLVTDFGAVAEGHPVDTAVAVSRPDSMSATKHQIDTTAVEGGVVVMTGEPGVGKSWICEQLAEAYLAEDWIVARHHCWLGADDVSREERVVAETVIGSLLRSLETLVPTATVGLRPRFAASEEALSIAVAQCRATLPDRRLLLIVDGLDHVDRVVGRRSNDTLDPSARLVQQLLAVSLPPGACLVIASQPGSHLALAPLASPAAGQMSLPRMTRCEVETLARKHGLLSDPRDGSDIDAIEAHKIVDLVFERSGGNALYATYLCRHAAQVSPLELPGSIVASVDLRITRLGEVPDSAQDLDSYYEHLLAGLTPDQDLAIGVVALCNFALSSEELAEALPAVAPMLSDALAKLAPVITSQPGLGGLRIHHESLSRHVLRDRPAAWLRVIREAVATWLRGRGFFADSRAFRHLPELLMAMDEYDEFVELFEPSFVPDAIRNFHPPQAIARSLALLAQACALRFDWPTLISCVEKRKALDTYVIESLPESIVPYASVVVSLLGPDVVRERLIYEGRPTFATGLGLLLCRAVDRAGGSAPWHTYVSAWSAENHASDSSSDAEKRLVALSLQLGTLRLRARGGAPPIEPSTLASRFDATKAEDLEDLIDVLSACITRTALVEAAALMTVPLKQARVYLSLAALPQDVGVGMPSPLELARSALQVAPKLDFGAYVGFGIPAQQVLDAAGISDIEGALDAATEAVVGGPNVDPGVLQRWLSLIRLGHDLDPRLGMRCLGPLNGEGFYRAWLRYVVATIGLRSDVKAGITTPAEASATVKVALAELVKESSPFTGTPRACDLYSVHPLIHDSFERSLGVIQPSDLDAVLESLLAIGDRTTTTTNFGLPENGPLTVNALLALLARISDAIGATAIHALMTVVRERRDDSHAGYGMIADFELETAAICLAAGAHEEAAECWRRACLLLASYGGHKDPTLSELTRTVPVIAALDNDSARSCLTKLVDPVYLVAQHTDGRDTSHYVDDWWRQAVTVDPAGASRGAADLLLLAPGLEDRRAHATHTQLLETLATSGDPMLVGALRLTIGDLWRDPKVDLAIVSRLETEMGKEAATDEVVTTIAHHIAASYDDQALTHSSTQPDSHASAELADVIVRLGGPTIAIEAPYAAAVSPSSRPRDASYHPANLQNRLHAAQRPILPRGRAGVVAAARDYAKKRYDDSDAAPRWDFDGFVAAVGWRVLEAVGESGADAGIEMLDDLAREVPTYSDNAVFAAVGHGLANRCDLAVASDLRTVAGHALALAYTRTRGGGGWQEFAGESGLDLWTSACQLDKRAAETVLAQAIVAAVRHDEQRTYGVTQGTIFALAAGARDEGLRSSLACWEAAFMTIRGRLPGEPVRYKHGYRPSSATDEEVLGEALATLAVSTVAQPLRGDIRRALIAAAALLTCRPTLGQTAVAHALAAKLDAGRTLWLLDLVRANAGDAALEDSLRSTVTELAQSDWLSVRALAADILESHGYEVPTAPVTAPLPKVRLGFQAMVEG